MNERIQELVGQAKFMAEETLNKQISANAELNAFAEKFADLILEEVMQELFINGYEDAFDFLNEHFEVEE